MKCYVQMILLYKIVSLNLLHLIGLMDFTPMHEDVKQLVIELEQS